MPKIVWDRVVGGYAAFAGPLKVAVITTSQNAGLVRNNVVIYEAMPKEAWTIHFTSPGMHIDLVRAVLDSLPADAAV